MNKHINKHINKLLLTAAMSATLGACATTAPSSAPSSVEQKSAQNSEGFDGTIKSMRAYILDISDEEIAALSWSDKVNLAAMPKLAESIETNLLSISLASGEGTYSALQSILQLQAKDASKFHQATIRGEGQAPDAKIVLDQSQLFLDVEGQKTPWGSDQFKRYFKVLGNNKRDFNGLSLKNYTHLIKYFPVAI